MTTILFDFPIDTKLDGVVFERLHTEKAKQVAVARWINRDIVRRCKEYKNGCTILVDSGIGGICGICAEAHARDAREQIAAYVCGDIEFISSKRWIELMRTASRYTICRDYTWAVFDNLYVSEIKEDKYARMRALNVLWARVDSNLRNGAQGVKDYPKAGQKWPIGRALHLLFPAPEQRAFRLDMGHMLAEGW